MNQLPIDLTDKRFCFLVQRTVLSKSGQYLACIAVEGRRGYYLTEWEWGEDFDLAEKAAASKNADMGINELDAWNIVMSTMFTLVGSGVSNG